MNVSSLERIKIAKNLSKVPVRFCSIHWESFDLIFYLFIYLFIYYLFQLYLMLVQLIPFANEDQKYFQKQKTKKNSQK